MRWLTLLLTSMPFSIRRITRCGRRRRCATRVTTPESATTLGTTMTTFSTRYRPAPGHGEFNALWHVFAIMPANALPATQAAYAARLPMTSEAAVDAAIAAGVAREVDTGSYFLCSIVNTHAAP
jgi:hypothetical protein